MTYVDRITESQFHDQLTEIEEEYNVSLDDLGIEVQRCSHPEDVNDEMDRIRREIAVRPKETAAQIQDRWTRDYARNARRAIEA